MQFNKNDIMNGSALLIVLVALAISIVHNLDNHEDRTLFTKTTVDFLTIKKNGMFQMNSFQTKVSPLEDHRKLIEITADGNFNMNYTKYTVSGSKFTTQVFNSFLGINSEFSPYVIGPTNDPSKQVTINQAAWAALKAKI